MNNYHLRRKKYIPILIKDNITFSSVMMCVYIDPSTFLFHKVRDDPMVEALSTLISSNSLSSVPRRQKEILLEKNSILCSSLLGNFYK